MTDHYQDRVVPDILPTFALLLLFLYVQPSGRAQGVAYNNDLSGNLVSRGATSTGVPLILRQPTMQIVAPGNNGGFSVVVADAASAIYQWRFNSTNIAGATGDALLLTNVTAASEGPYRVVITNSSGSVTSNPVMLYWDSDGDGLPDSWEIANFGSITNQSGLGDFDHDGVSNLKEFTDVTSPTNSTSFNPHLTIKTLQCSVSVSPDLPSYTNGQSVTLTAVPYVGQSFLGWSKDVSGTNNPVILVMNGNKSVTGVCGFPLAESLDTTNLVWITGGDIGCYGQSHYTHDGVDAVESGPITTNQQSWVETTVGMTNEGTVSFWWRVQGDTFTFSTNGAQYLQISSEYDWELRTAYLPAGTNTLRWTYSKTYGTPLGNDSAWLDQVVVTVYTNPLLDTDSDGMPDLWEYKYFGTLTYSGSGDYDGDGVSNLNEYQDGTNPADSSSFFPRLTVAAFGGSVGKSPNLPKYSPGQTVTLTAMPDSGLSFVGWGGDLTGTNTPQDLVMNGNKKVSAVFGLPLAQALDTTNLAWIVGGDIGWFGETNVTHDGIDAAQSGAITNNQASWMQTTVTGPVTISYWWKVSSYQNVDYLSFYIGGVQQTNVSGETDWRQQSFTAGPGPQTLKWQYAKSFFGSAGQDKAWVDQVSLSAFPTIPLADAVDATNLTWTTGGDAGWFGQASITHDGTDAAQSWSIGNSQESWMETTVIGPGTLTFWWKVSSETNYDRLEWYVNGTVRTNISGEVDWRQQSVSILPGTNTLRWRYAKDSFNSVGQDRGEVDQVSFVASPTIPLPEALDATNLTWTTGGSVAWFGQTNVTHDGVDAGQSGPIGNSQQSWVETTTAFTSNAVVSFWWTVSSESSYDFLTFFINGVQQNGRISGEVGWQQKTYNLSAGTNALRWQYSKNGTGASGSDAGWVDQVSFVLTSAPPSITLAQALDTTNLVWTTGGNASWLGQSTVTHDGVDAAESGTILNSQESWMETTVSGPGALSFWWNISSESGYDFLEFRLNGILQTNISGTVDWQQQLFTIPSGNQVLTWRYSKDSTVSSGQDKGWVDQLNFTTSRGSQPMLSISPVGNQVVISWPTNAVGFVLEANTNLVVSNAWTTVTNTPVVGGTQYTVTNSSSIANKFYRLRNP